ncbi:carbohydrate ABC transporter permease [Halanaerobacter jeridensis]|uniref:Raffinose/stachyose/melibiose transport system permease protein n=1 Tax=Halanaerobacter jeridensis TaxID=706427 RepID=A0A939BNG6_9FIRM|nr:carbohydrate ABC transporter permease [Halanaerobacter jeridensis]MBM7555457.1 raffinose/stachyose/melibiose transport system permease protein [Halanaerobacter jeridensis]
MNKQKKLILRIISVLSAGLFLVPFYIMLINSFKTKKQLFLDTLGFPKTFDFNNYIVAWERLEFLKVFFNSLIITVGSLTIVIIFSSMAAWMLQRTKSKLSTFIFFVFVASMLIPFQAVMLPLVRIMGKLNLLNMPGLIFMYLGFQSSLSIFLYHGFVKGIPKALDEAAIIDGCNSFQIFWYIIFPLLKPITITVSVLNAVWIWNDYLLPSLVINKEASHTIPLRIFFFFGEYTKQWHLAMAGLTLAIIPVIIFYFFAQKHIIKGVTDGSVK